MPAWGIDSSMTSSQTPAMPGACPNAIKFRKARATIFGGLRSENVQHNHHFQELLLRHQQRAHQPIAQPLCLRSLRLDHVIPLRWSRRHGCGQLSRQLRRPEGMCLASRLVHYLSRRGPRSTWSTHGGTRLTLLSQGLPTSPGTMLFFGHD